jgi:LmbE family N-acetylglucosaminyl deacetylase
MWICLRSMIALAVWLGTSYAASLPLLKPLPGKSFLAILPHHDDHTHQYGFGGLIARLIDDGYAGRYVRVTNDEKDGGHGWGNNDLINEKETYDAVRALGIDEVISFNWRNDHMDSIPANDLRAQLILLLRRFRPDVVLSYDPWGHYDRNPDHRRVSRALADALAQAGYANTHAEHLALGLKPHRAPFVFYAQRFDYGKGHEPNVAVELTESQVARKARAYWLHRNVRVNPASARAIRQALDARGLRVAELDGLNDEEAAIKMQEWLMYDVSAKRGRENGVPYAEVFYFIDEWDHLPGLKDYLRENAVTK